MKKFFENIYRFRILLILLWVFFILLLALFYPMGGDETGHFHSAKLLAKGQIPILDFFTIAPLGLYIPYAAIARWFSPSLEAARLLSAFSCITVPLLITLLIHKFYGRTLAVFGFFIIAFSHWYFTWNIQVLHYPIVNLGLFTSIFILFYFRPRMIFFFFAGFAMGWAICARLSLGPTGAALFILAMTHVGDGIKDIPWTQRFLRRGLPFAFGGVLASVPSLAVLVVDPEAFSFNLLGVRMNMNIGPSIVSSQASGLELFSEILKDWLYILYLFFYPGLSHNPKAMGQNFLLIILIAFFIFAYFTKTVETRKVWKKKVFQDNFLKACLWLIPVIILSHFIPMRPLPYYIQYIFPLMTIIILGVFFHGGIHTITPLNQNPDGWIMRALTFLLVPYVLYHFAFSTLHLLRRNNPNISRPVTLAHVGCWIQANSEKDEKIMSFVGSPVVLAGRLLPRGYEYIPGITHVFWMSGNLHYAPSNTRMGKPKPERIKIYRLNEFKNDLQQGHFRILITEYQFERWINRLNLQEARKRNYHLFATTGGGKAWEERRFDIYLRNDQADEDFTKMPTMKQAQLLEQLIQLLKGKITQYEIWPVFWSSSIDALDSITQFPADISLAWSRLRNSSHMDRCSQYLERKTPLGSNK